MNIEVDDLCKDKPEEFKQYMHYCRQLKFEEEPDYKLAISFFTKCLKRHKFDPTVFDYTWKVKRLESEKSALKEDMLKLIEHKPKPKARRQKRAKVTTEEDKENHSQQSNDARLSNEAFAEKGNHIDSTGHPLDDSPTEKPNLMAETEEEKE